MKLVHSEATLSQVHSNIWMMTFLLLDGALVRKECASAPASKGGGRASAAVQKTPRAASAASLIHLDMPVLCVRSNERGGRGGDDSLEEAWFEADFI